ncbi:MAG: hypothetical protein IPM82_22555 [Saprospiraceae bacterium]|nr:hypothetical protein [Saprospiraceae bacterium]
MTGATRMRVSMKRGGFASSCETFANGEVEDYTINISNTLTPGDTDNRAASLSFEAVPEKTWVNLRWCLPFCGTSRSNRSGKIGGRQRLRGDGNLAGQGHRRQFAGGASA